MIYGGNPLYYWTLAMHILQFSGILANCHKPILRKESNQMFIDEEFIKLTL